MKKVITVNYPQPPEIVLRALADRAFHEDKMVELGALQCEVLECDQSEAGLRITISRQMQNEAQVPRALKKFIPSIVRLTHTDEWDVSTQTGTVHLEIEGVPVVTRMAIEAVASGGGTNLVHDCEVKSSAPLIGGLLEKFSAAELESQIQNDATVSAVLVDRYR